MKFCWHTDEIRCDNCKPKRIELGCASQQCFCTGRCKRTQEEQDAYEKMQREGGFFGKYNNRGDK